MKMVVIIILILIVAMILLFANALCRISKVEQPQQPLKFNNVKLVKKIDVNGRMCILVKSLKDENLITIYSNHVENAKQFVYKEQAKEIAYIQQNFDLVYNNIDYNFLLKS